MGQNHAFCLGRNMICRLYTKQILHVHITVFLLVLLKKARCCYIIYKSIFAINKKTYIPKEKAYHNQRMYGFQTKAIFKVRLAMVL